MNEKENHLSEELIIVGNSGEIPEIAFHSAIHYLTADPEGPGLTLAPGDLTRLGDQVVARYREIILRDLNPDNRDLRLYRGVKRCIWNWERLEKFWQRQQRTTDENLRREIGQALCAFLAREAREVLAGERTSSLNCLIGELAAFSRKLGIDDRQLPVGWQLLCPDRVD